MKRITLILLTLFAYYCANAQIAIIEGLNATTLPTGWTQTSFANTTAEPCEGTHSWRRNFWASGTAGSITSPNLVAASNGTDVTVSFQWKGIEYGEGDGVGFTVSAQFSTDDGAIWQTIGEPISSTEITECETFSEIIPAALVPNGSSFKFRLNGTWISGDCYFYADDFSITQVSAVAPQCIVLSSPANNATNVSSSVISWTVPMGIPTGYKLNIGTTSGGTDLLNMFDVGNVLNYNLTSLTPSTTYFVTVIPYNANGDATACSESSFTSCGIINTLPWTENFDSLTTGTNVFPSCWNYSNVASTWSISTTPVAYSGANSLRRTWSTDGWAFTPKMTLVAGTSYTFSYFVKTNSATVGYAIDVTAGMGQTPDDMVETLSSVTDYQGVNWTKFSHEFTPSESGDYSIGLHVSAPSAPSGINFDDFKFDLTPSCVEPTSLIVEEGVTSNSATISWEEASIVPADGYEYYLSTVNTAPTAATDATGTVDAGVLFAELTLNPQTTYYVWVRSVCSDTDKSEWSTSVSLTTLCEPTALPWTEGFEGLTAAGSTIFPGCWKKENGDWRSAINSTTTYDSDARTGTYFIENAYSATNEFMWTPGFELTAGVNYDFSFWYASYGSYSTWDGSVFYSSSQSSVDAVELAPFIVSGTVAPSTYTQVINTFTPDADGIYYFAIRVNATSAPWYLSFDDFAFGLTPECAAPTGLLVDAAMTTDTTASVYWDESVTAPSNGYEYLVTETSEMPLDTATPTGDVGAGVLNADLIDLNPNTMQYVWVRSVCSASVNSAWGGPLSFMTMCEPVSEFAENFDAAVAFPDCWKKVGSTGSVYVQASATSVSLPNNIYFYSGSATTQAVLALPTVSNATEGTHRLKFKARAASTVGGIVEVGYLEVPNDAASFVSLASFTTTSNSVYDTFVAELGTQPTTGFLALRHSGVPANSLYLDDISWEVLPIAVPLCADAIATTNACGNFATVLSWDDVVGSDGYYLSLGTTPGGSDILNSEDIGGVLSYSFTGEIAATYYFTVTPYNSFGSAEDCTEQSFTTSATGCYCPSVPTSNDGNGITNVVLGNTSFPNTDVTYFDHTATSVDLPQGLNSNLQITFATGYTYDTNVWIDFNDNFAFESSELVFVGTSTNINPVVFNASFDMPVDAALGTHRMRIVSTDALQNPANPCYNGSYGVTLDFNVAVIPAPSCLPPTGLVVEGDVGSSTASISWTASGSSPVNGYDYYVSTTNTAPTAGTEITGSVEAGILTADLTSLVPSTTHYVWVRSECGTNDYSDWSASISFVTSCVAIDVSTTAWTEGFESLTAAGTANFPACWLKENGDWRSAINSTTTYDTDARTGTYFIQNAYSAVNEFIWTPGFQLTAGVNYDFSFWYSSYGSYSTWDASVFYNTNPTATDAVELAPFIATGTVAPSAYTEVINTFTPETSGVYYFAIRVNANSAPWYLSFDDFKLEAEDLKTVDFNTSTLKAYPNPVKDILNLSYTENITNVEVFNLLGQQVKTTVVNSNQAQFDMSDFASGTYLVKITSNNLVKTIKVIKE